MRRAVDEIDAHLQELERCIEQNLGTWSGEAAEAYRQAQREWDTAAGEMQQVLADAHRFVVTAHGNHASAVRTNSRIWAV